MASIPDKAETAGSKIAKNILLICFSVFLSIFFSEVLLRMAGFTPWQSNDNAAESMIVKPGGSFNQKDALLGFKLHPGSFTITLQPGSFSYKASHMKNTLRATHPPGQKAAEDVRDAIWIFGCSFTYGYALNDNETYPWLLQERLPHYEVVNFGVSGYGTVQSLLQFRNALTERIRPKIAVLAYASFHDVRNTFSRAWRKSLASYNKLGFSKHPAARFDKTGKPVISMEPISYSPPPFIRHLALVNLIDTFYNNYIDATLLNSHRVSKEIILEFYREADKNGIVFIVAGIKSDADTKDMLLFCRKKNIPAIDISVDLSHQDNALSTIHPHPSASANRLYAEKLLTSLIKRGVH